jgi:hypothetical protein
MQNDNVYYVKVYPYIYTLDFELMVNRFVKSNILVLENIALFKNRILSSMQLYPFLYSEKNKSDYEIDKIVTKNIMVHLQRFFKKKHNSTFKKRIKVLNRTKKYKYNII